MGILDSFREPYQKIFADDIHRRLCEVIHDATGLSFSETSRYYFEKRIKTRLDVLGNIAASDYVNYLLYDSERDKEWDQLIALLTTNETYFMREERQLRCFQKDILPNLRKKLAGRTLRIWSAGCSTGEEPYTVAILVQEAGGFEEGPVEIVATDINTRVLARAKKGLFREGSFRAVDATFKERWFQKTETGEYAIRDEIRNRIHFSRFNLFDLDRYALVRPYHVIFCRNVIIYFDMDAKAKVVNRFWEKLNSDGFLLLGHSESLLTITDRFKLIHLPGDLVYGKVSP